MEQLNVSFCWQMFQRTVVGWVILSYKNLSSFNFYSILEENCVADINNEAFECNIFVDNCCKTVFGWVILSCKSKVFWKISKFEHHFQEISLFKINDFGEINIWRFWWRRNVMKTKIDCQKLKRKVNVSLENHFAKMLVKKS